MKCSSSTRAWRRRRCRARTAERCFRASAIHWVDPEVSWRKVADALVDGGTVALLSYFGLQDSRSAEDQQALRAGLARVAPELASDWPIYRDLDQTLAGAAQRHDNVSEAWAWLGSYEVARRYVPDLFGDVRIAAMPILVEHTADALNALLGTMSFSARLAPASEKLSSPRTTRCTSGSVGRSARAPSPAW